MTVSPSTKRFTSRHSKNMFKTLFRVLLRCCVGIVLSCGPALPVSGQSEPSRNPTPELAVNGVVDDSFSDRVFMFTGETLESAVPEMGHKHFEHLVANHEFVDNSHEWGSSGRMKAHVSDGILIIEADREHPQFYHTFNVPEGEGRASFRLRTETASDCIFRWQTSISPRLSDDKMTRIRLINDGQWHEYEIEMPIRGALTNLVVEMTADNGRWDTDYFRLWINEQHPLAVTKVTSIGDTLEYTVDNKGEHPITFRCAGQKYTLGREEEVRLAVMPEIRDCFYIYKLHLEPEDYPDVEFSAFRYHPEIACRWYLLPLGPFRFCITESGNMARIQFPDSDKVFAIIAPFVHDESRIPFFSTSTPLPLLEQWQLDDTDAVAAATQAAREENNTLVFVAEEMRLVIKTADMEIHVEIEGQRNFEGPVVRAIGGMRTALFAGCEFLCAGDTSSSKIDVDRLYANRFSPHSNWLTMPLMVFDLKTRERFGEHEIPVDSFIAMTWEGEETQPTFDIPNHLDVVNDMRMSVRSDEKTHAVIVLGEGGINDAVRWYLKRRHLPAIPPAPRSPEEQNALSLTAFRGPLAGTDGASWGYCAEPDHARRPYDSIAATVWRLSGQLPTMIESPVNGGSPIQDDSYYFLTGRSLELVDLMRERTERIVAEMRPDGSFLFPTRFPDVEATVPSVGYSARRTLEMMAYARMTGDRRIFQLVEKSLEYMTRFRIPQGGRFWESPLHTPDLLAAAHMVIVHVWAYEFSGEVKYLERAQYWALMGLPFVYLRNERPHMLYATVPMYGASERENPVWFGISQPWCGCVYAYGITLLGKYDPNFDWQKIARGILHAAESLQFQSGPYVGCIPDGFSLETQEPISWKVNPAPLAALRWLLDTSHDGCVVIHDRNIRVVSPFPAKLVRDGVLVEGAPEGMSFQILINGSQVVDVQGTREGRNFVPIK